MNRFIVSDLTNVVFDPEENYSFDPYIFISKEDFDFFSMGATSYVSDKDVAKLTGLKYNDSPVNASIGDILYYIFEFEKDSYVYTVAMIVPRNSSKCRGIFNIEDLDNYFREV